MRYWVVALSLVACGKGATPPPAEPVVSVRDAAAIVVDAPAFPAETYADLGEALAAIIPADARVIGLGELHARVDRAKVTSALALFTAALPRFGDRVSDLIVETWIVDTTCGQQATTATKKMETEVKRPEATKSEIALLADAARAAKIQPHAMKLSCDDYKTLVPKDTVDPIAMLTLTTRELSRITASAVVHRDKEPAHRPWIMVYGGALHNDRFPDAAVAEWSYAKLADKVTRDHFVEIDLIVPELAAADETSRKQAWFSKVETANDRVQVVTRNVRSFVVILPKSK